MQSVVSTHQESIRDLALHPLDKKGVVHDRLCRTVQQISTCRANPTYNSSPNYTLSQFSNHTEGIIWGKIIVIPHMSWLRSASSFSPSIY